MVKAINKLSPKGKVTVISATAVLVCLGAVLFGERNLGAIPLQPTVEEVTEDGKLYTPTTISALRTHSWLEDVKEVHIRASRSDVGTITLKEPDGDNFIRVKNLNLQHLAPRLHYEAASPPDEFDGYNLMLAEFSRNSLSVPQGMPGDEMAHYETKAPGDRADFADNSPVKTVGDFEFVPNRDYRPLRFSVVNNCLVPGLWELSAIDRSGEIYHSWFNMPDGYYYSLVARVNGLKKSFVKESLGWHEREVKIDLGRLREVEGDLGSVEVAVIDEEVGFSSQDSRRKMQRRYALCAGPDGLKPPERLSDLHRAPVHMSDFVPPGIYKQEDRKVFDFAFLGSPESVSISKVRPKTSYGFDVAETAKKNAGRTYLEFTIGLPEGEKLVIGNLPLHLLVKQEDFILRGFGVGILHASGFAERRRYLIESGPHPSFAYLVKDKGDSQYGVNSHARGLEQIFIRSYPDAAEPHWEVTVASFERIVDLVKYRIRMPESLVAEQREHSNVYIPPVYFSYRDDNVN